MEKIHTGVNSTTTTQVLHSSLATSNILALETASLKSRSTIGKATRLKRRALDKGSALSGFSGVVVAGMSGNDAGQTKKADGNSRSHVNHCCYVTESEYLSREWKIEMIEMMMIQQNHGELALFILFKPTNKPQLGRWPSCSLETI